MIVDDSNIIRNKIKRAHDSDKYEVVATASNGQEALKCFQKQPIDVVTMDITMPEMDGIACIKHLVSANPKVLILVVSALSDKATGIEALQQGAHGFLLKPFTEAQLSEALNELTDNPYV